MPWWERACVKHTSLSLSTEARLRGRVELSLWQAPTHTFSGSPTCVNHTVLRRHAGHNTSRGTVWAVLRDMVPRGQCPVAPQGFATVFDMQLQRYVVADMMQEDVRMALLERNPPLHYHHESLPHALYHGTGGSMEWLCKPGARLMESSGGMLGVGVYLGSFTKAVRFAAFARSANPRTEYSHRHADQAAAILRVLVFIDQDTKIKWLHRNEQGGGGQEDRHDQDGMRERARYFAHLFTASTAEKHSAEHDGMRKRRRVSVATDGARARRWTDARRAPFVDHESTWRRAEFDAVALLPICVGVNPYSGREVWVVRNEEWCVRAPLTLIRNVADLHVATVAMDPWQPWRRASAVH